MDKRETGKQGEKIAADFIRKRGYKILNTNIRYPEGEIDIVARDKKELVFLEVRTKSDEKFGSPEESITTDKKNRLTSLSLRYIQKHSSSESWRIEMVAVVLDKNGDTKRIELIPLY